MNLDEMLIEVFNNLGRPTNISPLDRLDDNDSLNPDLWGYKQLQAWINQGYKAITTWRTPNGRFYRQRDMINRKYIQWGPHSVAGEHTITTDTSELGYNSTLHELDFPEDDYYVDNNPPAMVLLSLKTLGKHLEYQKVNPTSFPYQDVDALLEYQDVYTTIDADWVSLAYFIDPHTLYTLEPLPWITEETELTIHERGINWRRFNVQEELDDLYAILMVRVIDKKGDMDLASRTENFTYNLGEVGAPSEYFREGSYLYFDRHIDKEYTLRLEHYRQAVPLLLGTDVPTVQERYHTPIVYWATQRGLLMLGENTDAYSIRGFLDMEMRSIIKESDLDIERLEGNFRSGFISGGSGSYG